MDRTLWKKAPFIAAALLATLEAPALWPGAGPGNAAVAATIALQDTAAQKSQAELAAKTGFVTIAPDDPAVGKATDAKDLAAVRKLTGKEGAIQGTVAKVYVSDGNGIVILNFARNFKEAATAVLKPANYAKLPDMQTLDGKRVLVTGKVIEFRGRPEIEIQEPGQVKIIK